MTRSGLFLCLLGVLLATVHATLPTISVIGSKFFTSDGKQFHVKGVAYQLIAKDPLVGQQQCGLDAKLMKELGANSIRVYHVDATIDHTPCMTIFADAGIYLWVDLDSFTTYVKLDTISWDKNKSDSYRQVMDEFQRYNNTAGFFVGNEVLNGEPDSPAAPFLLAAAADLKAYRDTRGYRPIPIGYSATDTDALGTNLQDYVVCRANPVERLDFYALNSYRWCGAGATFLTSGYATLEESFKDYPAPVFISETGCNTVPPRDFADQAAIFSTNMTDTWSGAIVYEWIREMNNYGLITYGDFVGDGVQQGETVIDGWRRSGTPTPIVPDFENLKRAWAAATPVDIAQSDYTNTQVTPRPCPESTAGGWAVDPKAAIPTIGDSVTGDPYRPPPATYAPGATPAPLPSGPVSPEPEPNKAKSGAASVQPPAVAKFVFERANIAISAGLILAIGIGATCLL